MVLSIALVCALSGQDPKFDAPSNLERQMVLASVDKGSDLLMLWAQLGRMDPPKKAPLNQWVFEYVTAGYARTDEQARFEIRFRVFNQYRPSENDPTDYVARLLVRLWDFNRWRLNADHNLNIIRRSVDVYLCAGGEPGAEQKSMDDPLDPEPNGRPGRVNNIYVYAVPAMPSRVEFLREVVHEYAHATWPPLGGFKEPENWASGDMGERVFAMWLLHEVEKGSLRTDDVMQVSPKDLRALYERRVLPDLRRVGTKGPDLTILQGDGGKAYSELMGLSSYAAAILPNTVYGRALFLNRDRTAKGFHAAIFEACEEKESWSLSVPDGLAGAAIWIPLRKGTVGGASVLRREGDWLKIQPTSAQVTVHNAKD